MEVLTINQSFGIMNSPRKRRNTDFNSEEKYKSHFTSDDAAPDYLASIPLRDF